MIQQAVGQDSPSTSEPRHHEVAIVGSGFSGLCAAINLRKAGIDDFVIFERGDSIGGTWRDNTYPGCHCDVPSYLYSFSFEPGRWSRKFGSQPEIREYLEHCTDKYDIRRHVELEQAIVALEYDEGKGIWRGETESGRQFTARSVIAAGGGLSNPAIPDIAGLDTFEGETWHSAQWNHDCDLRGKRVAVIGTGASAIQFVPAIQPEVGELHLFQRTAPWVLPKPDRPFKKWERFLLESVPPLARLYRFLIYWTLELRLIGFLKNVKLMDQVRKFGLAHIRRSIRDPELRQLVAPDFTPGCKRILMSNDYYQSLDQPNVALTNAGVAEIRPHAVVTGDGREIPVDVIIFGTGFKVHDHAGKIDIVGRGGRTLKAVMNESAEAYLGTTVHGFPNLFVATGPNTGLGHTSLLYMIEAQVHYMLQCIRKIRDNGLARFEVKKDVQDAYNAELQKKLAGSVWATGCKSWYLDDNGHNTTLYPDYTFRFRAATRHLDLSAYDTRPPLHEIKHRRRVGDLVNELHPTA